MNLLNGIPALIHTGFRAVVKNPSATMTNISNIIPTILSRTVSLYGLHLRGPIKKKREKNKILNGNPCLKGLILKTLILKPRKPNSANRKCVQVRLSNGKEVIAYVPGIGHNLQEHQFVLVCGGRTKDLPGVKVRCIRGAYDLPHQGK